MKVISISSLDKKINYPNFLYKYAFGTDENKMKILLEYLFGKPTEFKIEETKLDKTNFYDIKWNKSGGFYYLEHNTTQQE